jgi:hypothetical protein
MPRFIINENMKNEEKDDQQQDYSLKHGIELISQSSSLSPNEKRKSRSIPTLLSSSSSLEEEEEEKEKGNTISPNDTKNKTKKGILSKLFNSKTKNKETKPKKQTRSKSTTPISDKIVHIDDGKLEKKEIKKGLLSEIFLKNIKTDDSPKEDKNSGKPSLDVLINSKIEDTDQNSDEGDKNPSLDVLIDSKVEETDKSSDTDDKNSSIIESEKDKKPSLDVLINNDDKNSENDANKLEIHCEDDNVMKKKESTIDSFIEQDDVADNGSLSHVNPIKGKKILIEKLGDKEKSELADQFKRTFSIGDSTLETTIQAVKLSDRELRLLELKNLNCSNIVSSNIKIYNPPK